MGFGDTDSLCTESQPTNPTGSGWQGTQKGTASCSIRILGAPMLLVLAIHLHF